MLRIAILALTVLAGALSVSGQVPVATSTGTPTNSPSAPDLSKIEIRTVAFCDLVGTPEKYDNQIVRTQAIIYFGFEASLLYLPGCNNLNTWAAYDPSYDGKARGSRKLYKILTKGNENDYKTAEITSVGRFLGKMQIASKFKNTTFYMGYGHMNMYPYQFTIMRVESAKAAPADAKP